MAGVHESPGVVVHCFQLALSDEDRDSVISYGDRLNRVIIWGYIKIYTYTYTFTFTYTYTYICGFGTKMWDSTRTWRRFAPPITGI
jgi:hypothetical protein